VGNHGTVFCDGGGPLGHPLVFLTAGENNRIDLLREKIFGRHPLGMLSK